MTNEESQTSSGLLEALQPLFWSFGTSSAINKTKSRSAIKSPTFTPTGNFHWVHIYNPNQSNKSCSGSTSADRRLSTGSGSPSNFQLCSPSYPLQPTCILTHPTDLSLLSQHKETRLLFTDKHQNLFFQPAHCFLSLWALCLCSL